MCEVLWNDGGGGGGEGHDSLNPALHIWLQRITSKPFYGIFQGPAGHQELLEQVNKNILYEKVGGIGFKGNSGVKRKETRI